MFFFLLNNEIANEKPDLSQYLNIVINDTDIQILFSLVSKLVEEEKYFNNSPKLIDTFYNRIDIAFSNSSQISENIKKMLMLIFSLEPSEWYWTKSEEPVKFEDSLYDYMISTVKSEELKQAVENLKRYNNPARINIDDIMNFIKNNYEKL